MILEYNIGLYGFYVSRLLLRVHEGDGVHNVQEMIRVSIMPGHEGGCAMGHDMHNLRVTRVERVENMTLWLNYQRQKASLRERMQRYGHAPEQLSTVLARQPKECALWTGRFEPPLTGQRILDRDINEFGLWHGTKPATADILAESGFDERVASLRGLYGAGSYFADAMCKSNQYATTTNAQGEHCLLYCRVTMGSAYRTTQTHPKLRRPEENPATPGEAFDSIFAEFNVANAGRQAHNEFVVFRHDQVYPEFIVWYTL
eukprot:COSAG01_NODE_2702_length_7228_cov_4.014869_3_plen_259_part_00